MNFTTFKTCKYLFLIIPYSRMIISQDIKINKPKLINTETILEELNRKNIVPIRWAVIKVEDESLIISVSYVNN